MATSAFFTSDLKLFPCLGNIEMPLSP